MNDEQFQAVVDDTAQKIKSVLGSKAAEYARGDRLSNFKRAAALRNTTPERALEGMLTKHVVALYDYLDDLDKGKLMPMAVWEEKIQDSINYLVLLRALLRERWENANCANPALMAMSQQGAITATELQGMSPGAMKEYFPGARINKIMK